MTRDSFKFSVDQFGIMPTLTTFVILWLCVKSFCEANHPGDAIHRLKLLSINV